MPNAPYTPDITLYYRKSGSPYHVPDTPAQCFDGSDLENCYTNVTKVYNGEIDISEIKSCSYSVVCNHYLDSNTCSNPAVIKTFYFKHCEIFPTIVCDNMIPTVYENITVTETKTIAVTKTSVFVNIISGIIIVLCNIIIVHISDEAFVDFNLYSSVYLNFSVSYYVSL